MVEHVSLFGYQRIQHISLVPMLKYVNVVGSVVLQRKVSPQTLLWRGLRSHLGSRLPSFPWHVLSVNFLVFLFHFDNAHVRDCVDFFNHLSQPYY